VKLQSRQEMVLELVQLRGEVSVAELSERAGVTPMTIRRDLETLERGGAVQRVHGGAIMAAARGYSAPFSVRVQRNTEAKERIGQAAAALVREREAVIIDVGTTPLQVARALCGRRNLTVATPSLHVANLLADNAGIRLIVTGGVVDAGERSMVGDFAEEIFPRLRCDTFVMGVGGIDVEAGCTEFSLEDAGVKRAALACARRCIVVADSTKLGTVTLAQVCPVDRVDVLITDRAARQRDLSRLAAEHMEVVVV
jgi:DeoR/GlpR family transcriptional regulator of sugar metabolism